jgi:hypothetical protein
MAKALTHLTEVVALGHFVEVDRFADLLAWRCGFPPMLGKFSNSRPPHRILMRPGRLTHVGFGPEGDV